VYSLKNSIWIKISKVMTGITHSIIASVENYNEPHDFPKVDYAKKDAEDFISTLKLLGHDEEYFIPLIDGKATKSTIISKVKYVAERAKENDRIIIYFAGHGFYEDGKNLLAPVDVVKIDKPETCVPIDIILGHLKKSLCKQNILFIDCCHSGFIAGTDVRDGEDSFMADELIYQFSKEEYCVGFASCKSNQKSISHPSLQNGVWSHFLNKALRGEAENIYTSGLLFSDKLQGYLNKETSQFVKMNTVKKKDQTPIKFGSETDKFIIADINPILEEKRKTKAVSDLTFTNIVILSQEFDDVKRLPAFQKRFHSVPDYVGSKPDSFIKSIGKKIIEDEIAELSVELKEKLKYKRAEIKASAEDGYGSIETPDFDYNMSIGQSEEDPGEYVLIRKLENFSNSDVILSPVFNGIFSSHFDKLEFQFPSRINIEKLIDKIESLPEGSPITVTYTPSDFSSCSLTVDGLDQDIYVTTDTMGISFRYQTSPLALIEVFKETRATILSFPELKLLEE
jgi:Caspase domain